MIQIPDFKEASADFTQDITLDNIVTTIRMVWNTRVDFWFLTLTTPNSSLSSFKAVLEWPLTTQNKAIFFDLPGDFIMMPLIDNPGELDYNALNNSWALFYLTEDEVEQWYIDKGIMT